MNSTFVVREFKEGLGRGGGERRGYKIIQKVLFTIPCYILLVPNHDLT